MGYYEKKIKKICTGSWYFDVTLFGKRFRKTVNAPKSAIKTLYRRWGKNIIDSNGSCNQNYMLYKKLDEFLVWCKKAKNEQRYSRYKFTISLFKQFFNNIKLSDFRPYSVVDYKIWRKKNTFTNQSKSLSNTAINKDITMLSHFFNYCIERNYYIYNNPCFRKKEPESKRKIRLSLSQIKELFSHPIIEHLRTALYLVIFGGLRRGEICQLKWDYIIFSNSIISLPESITKDKDQRDVDMPLILLNYLKDLKNISTSEYVITYRNRPIKEFRSAWENLREKLSFKYLPDKTVIHFHDLRHVYAESLKDLGVSISDISALLGHSNYSTTERYLTKQKSLGIKKDINKLNKHYEFITKNSQTVIN